MSAGASAFSPSLTLAGMDYIAPSAACIKPTLIRNANSADTAGGGGVAAQRGGNSVAPSAAAVANGARGGGLHADVVKITLQDCLACSGCVTTAETVLVNAQSRSEIIATLLTPAAGTTPATAAAKGDAAAAALPPSPRPRLVTISPQSCASLAAYLGLSMSESYALMAGFLREALTPAGLEAQARSAAAAAETSNGNEEAQTPATVSCDTAAEDEESSAAAAAASPAPSLTSAPPPSSPTIFVVSLEWAEQLSAELTAAEYSRRRSTAPETLPMIVSACPGWVCYCEKQGSALLPHLCPVMSAQGIAGSYAKRAIAADLYHISIQPCFDRKLEAARDSMPPAANAAEEEGVADGEEQRGIFYTDCVLSTAELLEWMKEVDPTLPWRAELDNVPDAAVADAGEKNNSPAATTSHDAARLAGSGRYHQCVIADRLRRAQVPTDDVGSAIRYEAKRNHNHQLATCAALPGEVFCVGYGFQQIQNVVRGLKKKMPAMRSYTFVELMACPDGCLNGGGQVRPAQQPHSEVLDAVIGAYARHTSGGEHSSLVPRDSIDVAIDSQRNEEEEEEEKAAQRRRLEQPPCASPSQPRRPFDASTIAALAPSLGDALWRCSFRDREKEFAEMLNAGNIHSLKW